MHKLRQIAITEENYFILKSYGKAGDSFNDVISKMLKTLKTQQTDQSDQLTDQSVVSKPITGDGYGHEY
jgi:predicted CopG family antitoxin